MTAEKKKQIKSIMVKAGKTFVQAFISYLSIDSMFGITSVKALEKIALSVLVGALAAGISAVWNSLMEWLTIRIDEIDIDDETETENTVEVIDDDT